MSTGPQRKTGLREASKKMALVIATLALSSLFAEVVLRIAGIGEPVLLDVDPTFGTAPIPGAEGTCTREGRGHVRITEHGFRGVDHPRRKPEGTFRLVVLGDSYAEARQVELEEVFSAHVEAGLGRCAALDGAPVEVLNFGVKGYGTAQEYLVLSQRALDYDPDAVLLAFLTGNDVGDNHPDLRTGAAPFYELHEGELRLNDGFLRSEWYRSRAAGGPLRFLRRRSRVHQLVSGLWAGAPGRASRGELGLHDAVYLPPADEAWIRAWDVTEALLARMNADLLAEHRRFFVATLSNAVQVDPDEHVRDVYREGIGATDLLYPDRRVAEVGARERFPVLSLVPPLREHAEEHDVYLHGFENTQMGTGHWNATGHRVAGELMAAWLCEQLGAEVGER